MARSLKETSLVLILFICMSVIAYFITSFVLANPVTFISSSPLTGVVKPGESLKVRVNAVVKDRCQFTHNRFIDTTEGEIIYRDVVPGRLVMAEQRVFLVPIPKDIKPGRYIYRQTTHSNCRVFNYSSEFPSFGFEVRD